MKNNLETMSRIALFRDRETEPGAPATTGGVSVDLDLGSGIKSALAVEHDGDTIRGAELPTRLYAAERKAAGALAQKRAKPDFLAFVLAYFFGECRSAAAGAGYRHEISPTAGLELPTFTAIQRRGATVFTERLSGNYLEGFSLELGEGWVSLSAEVLGTGGREVSYAHETVTAPANTLTLTLADGVTGASAAERRANVYRVRARDVGSEVWTVAAVESVSGAAPAVITLAEAVGSTAGEIDFEVDYLPTAQPWCALPAAVDESPLRLVDARVVVDGWFDGEELVGGEELQAELLGFTVTGKNNLELRRFPGDAGPAALALRGGRELTVTLTESLRDTVLLYQADHPETEKLALALRIQGAPIAGAGGLCFGAELIFPRCGILAAPVTTSGKRLAQAGDLVVLDDGTYGGAVVRCFNLQTGYL